MAVAMGFPGDKESTSQHGRHRNSVQVWSLGPEYPWRRKWLLAILAWKIPWAEVGYSPWGCKESDTTCLLNIHTRGDMFGVLGNAKFHVLIIPFYISTNHRKVTMVCPRPFKQLMLPMLLFQPQGYGYFILMGMGCFLCGFHLLFSNGSWQASFLCPFPLCMSTLVKHQFMPSVHIIIGLFFFFSFLSVEFWVFFLCSTY